MHTARRREVRLMAGALLLAIGALVAPPLAGSAHAYSLEGCKWYPFGASVNITLGTEQPYAYVAAVAVNDWQNQLTNYETFFWYTASPNNGTQGPVFEHVQNFGNTGQDGITYYSCSSGGFVAPVNSYYNSYYTASYSGQQDEDLIGHEFGHALGLAHSGTGAACGNVALMYYMSTTEWNNCGLLGPQYDDMAGADAIYGAGRLP